MSVRQFVMPEHEVGGVSEPLDNQIDKASHPSGLGPRLAFATPHWRGRHIGPRMW